LISNPYLREGKGKKKKKKKWRNDSTHFSLLYCYCPFHYQPFLSHWSEGFPFIIQLVRRIQPLFTIQMTDWVCSCLQPVLACWGKCPAVMGLFSFSCFIWPAWCEWLCCGCAINFLPKILGILIGSVWVDYSFSSLLDSGFTISGMSSSAFCFYLSISIYLLILSFNWIL
jgi:hypothetical protein